MKQTIPAETQDLKEVVRNIYFNEIYFYQNIIKDYQKFQTRFPHSKLFNKIPKCLAVQTEEGKQKILMENLRTLGFKTLPRSGNFDDDHTKLIMEVYGQFHGLSAAFREHNPKKFILLTSNVKSASAPIVKTLLSDQINNIMTMIMQTMENEDIKAKLKIFTEKGGELAVDSLNYNGKNPVVHHGDCWSNNIMFKYDVSMIFTEVEKIFSTFIIV